MSPCIACFDIESGVISNDKSGDMNVRLGGRSRKHALRDMIAIMMMKRMKRMKRMLLLLLLMMMMMMMMMVITTTTTIMIIVPIMKIYQWH